MHCTLQEFQCQPCVGVPFSISVHGHKALGMHNGEPAPSLVRDRCEPFGGDTHKEICQKVFHTLPRCVVGHGVDLCKGVFGW